MDIIIWLVIGLVAGVLALLAMDRTLPREPMDWVGALIIGLIGGLVGGWLAGVIGLGAASWLGAIVVAFIGALIILWLLQRAGVRKA